MRDSVGHGLRTRTSCTRRRLDPVSALDELTPQQLAKREAALARVRKYGDPVLRRKARALAHTDTPDRARLRAADGA